MDLSAIGDAWRAESEFPSANDCLGDGDGEEEVGLADVVMIEEIHDVGAEVIGVENPAVIGDGDSELVFFIALAVERNESQAVGLCEGQ